ncbi:18275_t:CDS:2 [Rhizophagus irregularis]|nr:18275_t:CDS:2 [Rhizophagus irregularis]
MSTRAPVSCPFRSGSVNLPEHVQYFNYQGNISKNIENIQEVMSNSELFKLRCLEDLQGDADADAGDST